MKAINRLISNPMRTLAAISALLSGSLALAAYQVRDMETAAVCVLGCAVSVAAATLEG